MFTDSHCHLNRLNLEDSQGEIAPIFAAMKQAQVNRAMAIMCNFDEYQQIFELVQTHKDSDLQLGMSVGIHPCEDTDVLTQASVDRLQKLADHPSIWAIGETGLDYYWDQDKATEQKQSLVNHIHVSQILKKPLVIHTRSARQDTLDVLSAENAEHGIIHCFTEDWQTAKKALDLGFYISFSGIVTFKNAQDLREIAKKIPKDRLLIETDSPYLAPVPMRGKPNQPAFVPYVAQCLAELLAMSTPEIAALTSQNFDQLLHQYG